MILEEIYVRGLVKILAEGPIHSAELIEGRPLPDLVDLAGEEERLRRWAEGQAFTRVHPDSLKAIHIASRLPGLRWDLLRRKASFQAYNPTQGFPAWYKISIEKLRLGRGVHRGLRVTVEALTPETAGAEAARMTPRQKLSIVAWFVLMALVFTIFKIDEGGFGWAWGLAPAVPVALIFLIVWVRKKLRRRGSSGMAISSNETGDSS